MNPIFQFIRDGGAVMWPLLLLSVGAVAVIIERILAFKTLGHLAPGLLAETISRVEKGDFEAALQRCDNTSGPLAACLATILKNRHRSIGAVERRVEAMGGGFFSRLERGLPFLDTVTTIAPLLGLLGTVVGMIGTFSAISAQTTRGNSDAVLAGVGEALYATATGISIAVVCFVAYNFFAARLRSISTETEQAATQLINEMADAGQFSPTEEARRAI